MNETEQTSSRQEEPKRLFQFELRTLFLTMFLFAAFCAMFTSFRHDWALLYWSFGLSLTGVVLTCRRDRKRLGAWMSGTGIVLVLLSGILIPQVDAAHEAAQQARCISQLKQLEVAMDNYLTLHGSFPPAYIADKSGKPMHSWRVLLLPVLDRHDIYDQYNFDEPWNGPNNSKLHDEIVSLYRCPFDEPFAKQTETNYVVVVGPGTMFPGERAVTSREICNDPSRTIMIVEKANSGIHWMEPRDLDITKMSATGQPLARLGITSSHPSVVNLLFADGSVHSFDKDNEDLTMEWLKHLLSRKGLAPWGGTGQGNVSH